MSSRKFRILDSHVNIGCGELRDDPIKSGITPEQILQLMAESDIEKSIIFPASRPSGYADANQEVADYVKRYPNSFIGFGRIRSMPAEPGSNSLQSRVKKLVFRIPGISRSTLNRLRNRFEFLRPINKESFDQECRDELEKCFGLHCLQGVKVHPDEDGYPSTAVLEVTEHYRKPILIHCGHGISLRRIEKDIIKPFTMPIILAHMGGYPAQRKMYFRALELANDYPHVYLNTSFVFFQYILESAITSCPTKIIFGSDAPGVHPVTAISSITPLRISDEDKQLVFWDNMARILCL